MHCLSSSVGHRFLAPGDWVAASAAPLPNVSHVPPPMLPLNLRCRGWSPPVTWAQGLGSCWPTRFSWGWLSTWASQEGLFLDVVVAIPLPGEKYPSLRLELLTQKLASCPCFWAWVLLSASLQSHSLRRCGCGVGGLSPLELHRSVTVWSSGLSTRI